MYLKSLEIQGFKSFADRTTIYFNNDITSIVGPNGSGKSNISDAIRWVMGEMSSKELRGTKMEDVIFGGTQQRSPLGFAEATLTLDNSDHAFRMDTPEIMITRRYFRSGESEYYINKQSARLRDINELFMDTGLGKEGYSNIGQGRIDEIVSLKSTDRREIFEEAAGISKYRHRKEETERRLANTEENLLRIGDKITELELQVEPLRVQSEKAKKYLTYRDELRGLEVTVWLDSLEKLAAASQKAEADYNSAAFILAQQHEELERLYSAAEQYSLQLNQMNLQSDQMRDAISALEQESHRRSAEISVLEANADNQRENLGRVRAEMEDDSKRSGGISEQIAQEKQRVAELRKQLDAVRQSMESAIRQEQEADVSGSAIEKELLQQRAQSSLLLSEISTKKAEIASITASVGEVLERKKNLEIDHNAALSRRLEAEQKVAETDKRLCTAREDVQSAENTIAGYELRYKSRTERRDALQKELDALEVEEHTANSKLAMLLDLQREYEGFSKSVKVVMQESERGKLRGVIGTVADLIKTEDDYAVAIETALGAGLQNIVVKSDHDSKNAIRLLKQSGAGRATFLPLNMLQVKPFREQGLTSSGGFIGLAADLVRYDAEYDTAIQFLLGRTVVCESLDSASEMAKKFQSRFRIVTLDGQLINAGGSMTGGSAAHHSGILSRANEIERIKARLAEWSEKKAKLRQELTEAARAAEEAEYQIQTTQAQLRLAQDAVLQLDGEKKQYEVLLNAILENLNSYEKELQAIQGRSGADESRLAALRAEIADGEARSQAIDRKIADSEAAMDRHAMQKKKVDDEIVKFRMDVAKYEAECEGAAANASRLQALSDEMQGGREQKEALCQSYEAEIVSITDQIEASRLALEEHIQTVRLKQEELQGFLAERNAIEENRTAADRDAQRKNKEILDMEREAARLEQKKATTALEEKSIIDKLWDSYELTRTSAAEVAVEIESLAAANRRIAELRKKIAGLGTPNLGAIEEFERVNERYEYLTGQRDDVLHSKRELEEIVRTITGEMKEIFVREFGKINEYFSQTFVEMFGGGRAALEMEDPEDPLGCGIEIRVQPPGKQLKTITLLSGGEKAFVAIALYFAILKVRPASFCLLDEIDAALDDRNVERFAGYLRNLSDKTQFIVITHRRGTMEASDALYGVTMQERGISRILHIDLNQVQEQLGIME